LKSAVRIALTVETAETICVSPEGRQNALKRSKPAPEHSMFTEASMQSALPANRPSPSGSSTGRETMPPVRSTQSLISRSHDSGAFG